MTTVTTAALRDRVAGLDLLVLGEGEPVTVLLHGLAGSVAETRPLAAGLPGTRVLPSLRGHGRSDDLPPGWTYDDLADDLARLADATGATGVLGLSLGAGAVLRLLTRHPGRFERIVLALPAALDRVRRDAGTDRLERLGACLAAGDRTGATALLLAELPPAVRATRAAHLLAGRRADSLAERLPPRPDPATRPLRNLGQLAAMAAPTLVLAQQDDPLHPVPLARTLAAGLPHARLEVLPAAGLLWTARERAQALVRAALAPAGA